MKKRKVKYTDEQIGNVKAVADFLPCPDDLIEKVETLKVKARKIIDKNK